jgi:hypothetical protein
MNCPLAYLRIAAAKTGRMIACAATRPAPKVATQRKQAVTIAAMQQQKCLIMALSWTSH